MGGQAGIDPDLLGLLEFRVESEKHEFQRFKPHTVNTPQEPRITYPEDPAFAKAGFLEEAIPRSMGGSAAMVVGTGESALNFRKVPPLEGDGVVHVLYVRLVVESVTESGIRPISEVLEPHVPKKGSVSPYPKPIS
jgi:hypothetical protein